MWRSILGVLHFALFFWRETQALVLYVSPLSFLSTVLYSDFLLFHWVFIWQGLKEPPCLPLTLPLICCPRRVSAALFPGFTHMFFPDPYFYSSHFACPPSSFFPQNPPASAGDIRVVGSIPGLGRTPGVGNDIPLQYPCLENPMDRGAWRAIVHRVTKSQTWLKWFSTHFILILSCFPLPWREMRSNKLKWHLWKTLMIYQADHWAETDVPNMTMKWWNSYIIQFSKTDMIQPSFTLKPCLALKRESFTSTSWVSSLQLLAFPFLIPFFFGEAILMLTLVEDRIHVRTLVTRADSSDKFSLNLREVHLKKLRE